MLEKIHKMSMYNKVSVLEKIDDMFVCSNCCDTKTMHSQNPFTTSNPSLFLEHQRYNHSSSTDFECIYCCALVPISSSIQHIKSHFYDDFGELNCAYCSIPEKLNIWHLIKHVSINHSGKIVCPSCNSIFSSIKEVYAHLMEHVIHLFHCPFNNCFVKSHSKNLMIDHLSRKHDESKILKTRLQFLCSEKGARKSKMCNCVPSNTTIQLKPHDSFIVQTSASEPANTNNTMLLPKSVSPLTIAPTNHVMTTPKHQQNSITEPQHIALPFSNRVLAKLSQNIDEKVKQDLINKMNHYSTFQVKLEVSEDGSGQKQFVCATCYYRSIHSLADVRKHILGCHCSVSTSYTRLCLRASRLDTNTFQLFSDKKLISFANEKLKRSDQMLLHQPNLPGEDMISTVLPSSTTPITTTTTSQITTTLLEDSEPDSDSQTDAALSSSHNTPYNNKKRSISAILDPEAKANSSKNGSAPKKPRAPYNSSGIPSRRPYRQHNRYSNGLVSNNGSGSMNPNMLLRPDSPVPEVGQPLPRACPIEREINLAYSWTVLQSLIQGHCPEDYLPVLRAKMDVYASHKILLSRRPSNNPADKSPGKRFFLCSHCSNSSPHGMNDIRKHILGVHARLPERFKAAAMYCSRMNRENYALLSDDELLKKNQDIARMRAAALPTNNNNNSSNNAGASGTMNGVSLVKMNNAANFPDNHQNIESSPPRLPQFLSDLSAAFLQQQQTFNTPNLLLGGGTSTSPTQQQQLHLSESSPLGELSHQSTTNSTGLSTPVSSSASLSNIAVAMAASVLSGNWSNNDNSNGSINSFLQSANQNSFLQQQQPIISNHEDYKTNNTVSPFDFSANQIKSKSGNKGKSRRSLVLKSKAESLSPQLYNDNSESIPNPFNN